MAGDDADEPDKDRYAFPALARAAGEMLRAPDGPRIAALEIGGWDTHVGAGAAAEARAGATRRRAGGAEGRPGRRLAADRGAGDDRVRPHRAGERHQGHRPRHRHGRVRAGRRGGRRPRGWRTGPGLGAGRLLEDRDLQPTTDLRSVAKGLLAQHLRLDGATLAKVFPNSETAQATRGLLRA